MTNYGDRDFRDRDSAEERRFGNGYVFWIIGIIVVLAIVGAVTLNNPTGTGSNTASNFNQTTSDQPMTGRSVAPSPAPVPTTPDR
jgi:hypothetical protein